MPLGQGSSVTFSLAMPSNHAASNEKLAHSWDSGTSATRQHGWQGRFLQWPWRHSMLNFKRMAFVPQCCLIPLVATNGKRTRSAISSSSSLLQTSPCMSSLLMLGSFRHWRLIIDGWPCCTYWTVKRMRRRTPLQSTCWLQCSCLLVHGDNVTPETIAACWRHTGILPSAQNDAAKPVTEVEAAVDNAAEALARLNLAIWEQTDKWANWQASKPGKTSTCREHWSLLRPIGLMMMMTKMSKVWLMWYVNTKWPHCMCWPLEMDQRTRGQHYSDGACPKASPSSLQYFQGNPTSGQCCIKPHWRPNVWWICTSSGWFLMGTAQGSTQDVEGN